MASNQPLCFTANTGDNTCSVLLSKSSSTGTVPWTGYYSTDGSTWNSYTPFTSSWVNLRNAGDKVYFKGNITGDVTDCSLNFKIQGDISVSGNVNSMYVSSGFNNLTTLTYKGCFSNLFDWVTGGSGGTLRLAGLELPATTLSEGCYKYMFNNNGSSIIMPSGIALPATTLAERCYQAMFYGCTSLTTAPALPATTLSNTCYFNMFKGCTNLTTPPVLPATSVSYTAYNNMFANCTSLTTPPALPATTLAHSCYFGMFNGCTSLSTLPELPATELPDFCYFSMFGGCTSLAIYSTSGEGHQRTYTIPSSNEPAEVGSESLNSMFYNTGGDNIGTPTINTTYYIDGEPPIEYYTITTAVSPANSGTVTGGGVYEYLDNCTLTATPSSGYVFDHWSDGRTTSSINFAVDHDATYTAYFVVDTTYKVNKVVYNSQILLDLTSDTVDASHLAQGYTAHDCSGASITGTYVTPETYDGSVS